MNVHDFDLPGAGPGLAKRLRGLRDGSMRIEGRILSLDDLLVDQPPHATHFYSLPPRWPRLNRVAPTLAGSLAFILVGLALIAAVLFTPGDALVVFASIFAAVGILASVVWCARLARDTTARVLRWAARKREGLICSRHAPCPRCQEVKSWEETSSAGPGPMHEPARWV